MNKTATATSRKVVTDGDTSIETLKTIEVKRSLDEKGETTSVSIIVTDHTLRTALHHITRRPEFYDPKYEHDLSVFLPHIDRIKNFNNKIMNELRAVLKLEAELYTAKADAMLRNGVISFREAWRLFQVGTEIIGKDRYGRPVGGIVQSADYRGGGWTPPHLLITAEAINTNGLSFLNEQRQFMIWHFSGTIPVAELSTRPITTEEKARLTERGKIWCEYAIGSHYTEYSGHLIRRGFWSAQSFKAEGRCMVDLGTMRRIDDDYFRSQNWGEDNDENADKAIGLRLDPERVWLAPTVLHGFSFACKKWGEMDVTKMRPITFNDKAFDQLVLDEDKKQLVRALVTTTGSDNFADVITGKGGGCIFLLHGEPGTGKTLTAEAIAEILHRPLYSVSVGELGTDTDELEKRLRIILEVATIWNAVILLDEADIFLEARNERDIERNAMVGIFLRLLEYHQGVMFLTTNRVKNFDAAFHSRISVALKYPHLDQSHREAVWRNLLDAAGINGLDPAELAHFDINGRQIKTAIRLAQSLAKAEGVPVNTHHVMRTVGVASQFQQDLAS